MMTDTKKIAFFDAREHDRAFFDRVNAREKFPFTLKYFKNRLNTDTVPLSKGFDAVCVFVNDEISKPVIEVLVENGIYLVALRCAGYNNADLKAAYKNIHIVRVPAYSPHAVAEHAVSLLLSLNRKIHRAYYRTRDSNFNIEGLLGFDLYGKTAGVIGTGHIGKVFAHIMQGFGCRVLAYDPYPDEDWQKKENVSYVDLETLYRQCDVISFHCPLTRETYHMVDSSTIKMMKDGVFLINTSRGGLIDTQALIEALKAKKIGAAGLDVYEEESEIFFEDFSDSFLEDDVLARLLTFPQVLITSHQGFFTREALESIAMTTLGNINDYFQGKVLANEVCYRCGETVCRKKKEGRCF